MNKSNMALFFSVGPDDSSAEPDETDSGDIYVIREECRREASMFVCGM